MKGTKLSVIALFAVMAVTISASAGSTTATPSPDGTTPTDTPSSSSDATTGTSTDKGTSDNDTSTTPQSTTTVTTTGGDGGDGANTTVNDHSTSSDAGSTSTSPSSPDNTTTTTPAADGTETSSSALSSSSPTTDGSGSTSGSEATSTDTTGVSTSSVSVSTPSGESTSESISGSTDSTTESTTGVSTTPVSVSTPSGEFTSATESTTGVSTTPVSVSTPSGESTTQSTTGGNADTGSTPATSSGPGISSQPTTNSPTSITSEELPSTTTSDVTTTTETTDAVTTANMTSPTTTASQSTSRPVYEYNQNEITVVVRLAVHVGGLTFNSSLNNSSSTYYRELSREFVTGLNDIFRDVTGFKTVRVDSFSNGSVIANFAMLLYGDANFSSAESDSKRAVNSPLSIHGENHSVSFDDSLNVTSVFNAVADKMESGDVCDVTTDIPQCGSGHTCTNIDGVITCHHICDGPNKPYCDQGTCFYDDINEQAQCRCHEMNGDIYYGDDCSKSTEAFALSKTHVIAIAAGCGGFLALVIVILVIVICRRSKKDDYLRHDSGNLWLPEPTRDYYMDGQTNGSYEHKPEVHDDMNNPTYTYAGGKQHRVVSDERGYEVLIYPSNSSEQQPDTPITQYEMISQGSSLQNLRFPEGDKYEIKRPSVRQNTYQ